MLSKTLAIRPNFRVVLPSAPGDLRLTGWDREEVAAKTDGDVLDLVLDNEVVTISCDDDLILNVPRGAAVQVDRADGDVEVRLLMGALAFDSVAGDISLREVGTFSLGTVEGDVSVRGASGDISASQLESDASLRDVKGSVSLDSVAGDLFVRAVTGALRAHVEDDVVMYLELQNGSAVDVSSEGDILLHLSAKANASLSLEADEPDNIAVKIPGAKVSGRNPMAVVLGEGGSAAIRLKAEGDLVVTSESKEWESAAEFDFGGNWPLPGDFNERINRTVERATRTAERATRAAEEAARRAEERARHHEQQLRHHARRFAFDWSPGRGVPTPPSEPVSDEERMAILKMLQDKKITAADAEKLLTALEGGN